MKEYKSWRFIDGKAKWIIVDENGNIINKNPKREDLKNIEKEVYTGNIKSRYKQHTDKELLEYLTQFHKEIGRVPITTDFRDSKKYPDVYMYQSHFGSWNHALELAGLDIIRSNYNSFTNGELLDFLIQFYKETQKVPTTRDFKNNKKYPSHKVYINRFGSWHNALISVNLDVDTMVKKGILQNNYQKERLFELYVKEHFEKESIDLSGDNCNSSFDGICPNGKIYDAKSSGLMNGRYFFFHLNNKEKEEIEWYYLGGFNNDYTKLLYVWRVPGEFVGKNYLHIGLTKNYEYNIENMKEFEITEKFKDIDFK